MHASVIFCLHNCLAQGKVPVELNTVLLQLVSGLLFSATHFHTPVVEAMSLASALRRRVKAITADTYYTRALCPKHTMTVCHHAALHICNEGTVKVVLVLQCTFWSVTCKVWDIFNALLPSLSKLQLHMLHTLLPPFH